MRSVSLCFASVALALAACNDPAAPQADEGAQERAIALRFEARLGGQPAACGASREMSAGAAELTDLRLFVHDVRLIGAEGGETPLTLDEDGVWQSGNVAFLDFEDGSGACKNGSAETREVITGRASEDTYVGVRFRLGVPFDRNHQNPALAPPPLSLTAMQWGWQAGYKFMRFGAQIAGSPYQVHLGSTGCAGTIGAITGCARENRAEVEIAAFDPELQRIVLDIDDLLTDVDFGAPAEADGCMGTQNDVGCASVFERLGLDVVTGRALLPAEVFRAE